MTAVATRPKAVVTLASGDDAAVAAQLRLYLRDAEDATRRIAIAGAYCEWIVRQLPHGKLGAWLETHCPDVVEQTVRKWRQFARSLFAAAQAADLSMPPHEVLALAPESLPEDARAARAALDELLAGKTYRQLWFEFRQLEEGPDGEMHVKHGRLKGRPMGRTVPTEREQFEARVENATAAMREAVTILQMIVANPHIALVSDHHLLEEGLEAGVAFNNLLRDLTAAQRSGARRK